MIKASGFSALLDANVLYPAPLRDYLLRLAAEGIFKPYWTDAIQEEWANNLLKNRPDLHRNQLEKTKNAMNTAFPDANIENYDDLIAGLSLPDPDDCHVLAAGIKARVNVIVTNNTKDFPTTVLNRYDIGLQNADTFVTNLVELNPSIAISALIKQSNSLRNPQSIEQLLETLRNTGLYDSVEKLVICCSKPDLYP